MGFFPSEPILIGSLSLSLSLPRLRASVHCSHTLFGCVRIFNSSSSPFNCASCSVFISIFRYFQNTQTHKWNQNQSEGKILFWEEMALSLNSMTCFSSLKLPSKSLSLRSPAVYMASTLHTTSSKKFVLRYTCNRCILMLISCATW